MAEMNLEKMTETLKSALGDNLVSVILYGSAAAGDHYGKRSDYNLLVLTQKLELEDLKKMSPVTVQWTKQMNPPPLLFTWEQFKKSWDVFPLEIADIQDSHKILFGKDPFSEMTVSFQNMRLELEHELKGKFIKLRENFLMTQGDPKKVSDLMIQSLSTFQVLCKNVLRLYNKKPPALKMEALKELRQHISFDLEPFQMVEQLKMGNKAEGDRTALFEKYLKSIEIIVLTVDDFTENLGGK